MQGDEREDGYLFWGYVKSHVLNSGFFKENWLNELAFKTKRNKNKKYLQIQRCLTPKKYAQSSSRWQKLNPDKVCANSARRKAKKLSATPKWLTKQHHLEILEYYKMAKELEKIFPWAQHVDHIEPLQNSKICGLHVPWNMQILSTRMNQQKGNKRENL